MGKKKKKNTGWQIEHPQTQRHEEAGVALGPRLGPRFSKCSRFDGRRSWVVGTRTTIGGIPRRDREQFSQTGSEPPDLGSSRAPGPHWSEKSTRADGGWNALLLEFCRNYKVTSLLKRLLNASSEPGRIPI